MDLLRIATCGSVDDGKSTLIGRLLYDTNSITHDKIENVKELSKKKQGIEIDFSLFTDGLIAEREQGITIDVAHLYFSTKNRKYIIADSPGHEQYTRNMITGASKANASLILLDARKGIVSQTKRHMYINHLIRINEILVCINKMDLIDYSQEKFNQIVDAFKSQFSELFFDGMKIYFIPISSMYGDNFISKSNNTKWYKDGSLLEILEKIKKDENQISSRFYVQNVIRPQNNEFHDFRGYAGIVNSGVFKIDDRIRILPSNKTTQITNILTGKTKIKEGHEGQSIVFELKDDVDVSRGSLIIKEENQIEGKKIISAIICWMDEKPLNISLRYTLQINTKKTISKINNIMGMFIIDKFEWTPTNSEITLNTICKIELKLADEIYCERYEDNKKNGSFILIDETTNNTVAVGFVKSYEF